MKLTGEIKAITTTMRGNGKEKKTVHLQTTQDGLVFVEFQGWRVKDLEGYHEGHNVSIDAYYNGKTSKLNVNYNNIIGTKITTAL